MGRLLMVREILYKAFSVIDEFVCAYQRALSHAKEVASNNTLISNKKELDMFKLRQFEGANQREKNIG
jgi:hypothetical protein